MTSTHTSENALPTAVGVLSDKSVNEFLRDVDIVARQTLVQMASAESWTIEATFQDEGPQKAAALIEDIEQRLTAILDSGAEPDRETMLKLIAYVKSPRFNVLVRWVEQRIPGYTVQLSKLAAENVETHQAAASFMERLMHLQRTHTLWRVFNTDRLNEILELMGGYDPAIQ